MNPKKIAALLLITILALAPITATGTSEAATASEPQDLTPATLAIGFIPNIQFAPLYVAQDLGYFADEGIELEIQYGFGIDIFSLLATGQIDFGLSDSDQLIMAGEQNLGISATFQYYQSYPVSIVALADTVQEPEDLEGRVIGVPAEYGTSYIGLQAFLREYGLEGKVQIEPIGYTQVTTLLNGAVDAVVTFVNNEPIQLRQQGQQLTEWKLADFSPLVGASILASNRALDADPEFFTRFNRALARGVTYVVENPAEAVDISWERLGVEENQRDFVLQSLLATNELFASQAGYGAMDPDAYALSMDAMEELGLIEGSYDPERIIR